MTFREALGGMRIGQIMATGSRTDDYGGFWMGTWLSYGELGSVQFAEVSVDTETGFVKVDKIVAEMMAKPPLSLRAAKNVINNSITCDSMEAALAIERGAVMWLVSSEDSKEGVASFVEKRKPTFKGQ